MECSLYQLSIIAKHLLYRETDGADVPGCASVKEVFLTILFI